MKTYIASLLRHAFTALAGLGGYLFSKGLIDQADVSQVDGAGVSLGAALAVILTAVAGRFLLTLLGKVFSAGSGESVGTAGGLSLFCIAGTAAGLMGLLPSCSGPNVWPITGSLSYRDPNSGAKAGLVFSPNAPPTATLRVPIYDPATNELIGLADLSAPLAKDLPTVDGASGK